MRKLPIVVLVALLIITLVAGCGGKKQQEQTPPDQSSQQQPAEEQVSYDDGVYFAQKADFDDHGWKAMATVIVKDGKITEVFYDEINEEDTLKSFDPEYAANMKNKSGTTPLDAYNKLEQDLIAKQNPEQVDAVTGATHSSDTFKELVKEALSGSPVEAKGTYKEGVYKAAEKDFDERGWKAMAAVLIRDGKVAVAAYDEVNKDGNYKSADEEYAKNMKEKSGTTPAEAAQVLSKSVIDKQDADVDSVTGATGTAERFKTLMKEVLDLAK
ncbi:MAG TPA: FMN-binding protein [Thermoanaerobacterales bacterium]|uniref:FMN-binding protein n=1 Tax=Tepidanaerobacter sp. GT38 TaxID=2722793 RepID=UPI00180A1974|nr:FMN-binding protein [Tepidanaerobacter sp. GT38]MCG1011432.1 FMN-binding protein [Tepidanaerobacter sp. GT38]HHY41268.1 FMN-binding protein [Thermoanaerobacterales bacterium]